MKGARCKVKVWYWESSMMSTRFEIMCNVCERGVGTFSQHESAMAWAQVHAASSKHIKHQGE